VLDRIRSFFQEQIAPEDASVGADRRLQIATCALLLEVAHADDDFSADERALVRDLLRDRFELTEAQARELMALAEEQRGASTDLYQFARLINDRFDRPQKLAVLAELWRIVYSDGRLEAHEDALLHKLANLFGLRHQELITLKLQVKREQPGD
jgi:uncharacterized tellurite resistance protein B-like protein